MKTERRNLYRILHVQPEAPTEVITAVYRCLMSKLKMHPDLGGNHEIAARINHAYAVLNDPDKRKAYDVERRAKGRSTRNHGDTGQFRPMETEVQYQSTFKAGFDTAAGGPHAKRNYSGRRCPMCERALPRFIGGNTRCDRCAVPLSPIAHQLQAQRELLGRRMSHRVERFDVASVQIGPNHPFIPARLRDMSLTGVGLATAELVMTDSVIRIMTDNMDVVAHVIKVREIQGSYRIHARLLTGCFARQTGVFVSASA